MKPIKVPLSVDGGYYGFGELPRLIEARKLELGFVHDDEVLDGWVIASSADGAVQGLECFATQTLASLSHVRLWWRQ